MVMENGRIESVGTQAELLDKSPIYREVYESQTRASDDNATEGGEN